MVPSAVVQLRFVAMPNVQTAVPAGVYFSSGSRVRFPMRITRFKDLLAIKSYEINNKYLNIFSLKMSRVFIFNRIGQGFFAPVLFLFYFAFEEVIRSLIFFNSSLLSRIMVNS